MTTSQHPLVTRLFALWSGPAPDLAGFAELYADPVTLNGEQVPLTALVDRAASLQKTFERLEPELHEVVEAGDKLVVVFTMVARQIGTLRTPLGNVGPTRETVRVRTIDVLTLVDGRISAIWVAADELGMLAQLSAAPE